MHGHQVVVHWVGEDYRCQDYVNPVDGDEVPVPHYGLQMPTLEAWEAIVARVNAAKIPWVIEPTLRFEGEPGEQWTCFFKDPSGNNLEFKHMSNPEWLFAKYNVADG
jgi:extradiol dioxygenase family protein